MKAICCFILICIASAAIRAQSSAESKTVLMDSGRDKYHADLQLSTTVINQRYCGDGALQFVLRFTFRNGGGESIVLDKRSSVVPYYTVSRSAQLAAKGKHRMEVNALIGIGGKITTLQTIPDESKFVLLKAGDSHSEDHGFSIPLATSKLDPGGYVLTLSVLTWNYPQASNIEWRERWRNKGYLWTDAVTSHPMHFVIEKKPVLVPCSSD
jgi:hypothetical protein